MEIILLHEKHMGVRRRLRYRESHKCSTSLFTKNMVPTVLYKKNLSNRLVQLSFQRQDLIQISLPK